MREPSSTALEGRIHSHSHPLSIKKFCFSSKARTTLVYANGTFNGRTSSLDKRTRSHLCFDVWVENGTLHAMDMDYSNSTLTYSLSAVFGFRNEDYHRDSDTVEKLAAAPLYGGQQLGPESSLTTFQLRFLETAMVPFDVRAQQAAGAVVARTYADDAARGYYTIQVKLSLGFGGLAWCDSTCTLYFFAPLPSPRGAPNIFDGDDCSTKCKTSVFHDTEQVGNATVASLSSLIKTRVLHLCAIVVLKGCSQHLRRQPLLDYM
ncbi:uncharacterized protein LOC120646327 [Panicum virgatum]|uniref:Uncharacterized protein n=1 Tax=Panicum virgatum TaxID=38727 RepID=A0A8T0PV90_PANVG|nr:uncharacterized protein LOC120646327 [Panicum virgatum]KAG2562846.1 hypothetical protein PVAP13_8KG192929 [Panicum virgatum]